MVSLDWVHQMKRWRHDFWQRGGQNIVRICVKGEPGTKLTSAHINPSSEMESLTACLRFAAHYWKPELMRAELNRVEVISATNTVPRLQRSTVHGFLPGVLCTSISGRAGMDLFVNMLKLQMCRLVQGLLERIDAFQLQVWAIELMVLGIWSAPPSSDGYEREKRGSNFPPDISLPEKMNTWVLYIKTSSKLNS